MTETTTSRTSMNARTKFIRKLYGFDKPLVLHDEPTKVLFALRFLEPYSMRALYTYYTVISPALIYVFIFSPQMAECCRDINTPILGLNYGWLIHIIMAIGIIGMTILSFSLSFINPIIYRYFNVCLFAKLNITKEMQKANFLVQKDHNFVNVMLEMPLFFYCTLQYVIRTLFYEQKTVYAYGIEDMFKMVFTAFCANNAMSTMTGFWMLWFMITPAISFCISFFWGY